MDESKVMDALEGQSRLMDMEALRKKMGVSHDLAEVYSPWRVNQAMKDLKMRPGNSLDLTVPGPDGRHWDFSKPSDRRLAMWLVRTRRPTWVIGAPPMHRFLPAAGSQVCKNASAPR